MTTLAAKIINYLHTNLCDENDVELGAFGRRLMATLSVSGSGALRANISCALVLLSVDNSTARQLLNGNDGLIETVMGMVQGGANNLGPKCFLSAVDALTICDDRKFLQTDNNNENSELRFFGDLPPPSLEVMVKSQTAAPITLLIICDENKSGIRMEVPSLVEISHLAPILGENIAAQVVEGGEGEEGELPKFHASSYAVAEEFFSHLTTCSWASLRKISNKLSLDKCLELLSMAKVHECEIMKGLYARLVFERLTRQNAVRCLRVGMEVECGWLCVMVFRTVVRDFDMCVVGGGGEGGGGKG